MKGKQQFKKYVGYAKIKIPAVSIEERNDKKFVTVQVQELGGKLKFPHNFIVADEIKISKDGKIQFIDDFGKTTYAESVEKLEDRFFTDNKTGEQVKSFDKATARPAMIGEEDLTRFFASFVYVQRGDKATFDNFKAIAQGNIAEIEALVKDYASNTLGVGVGIRNGQYQTIYTRAFGKPANIMKAINNDTYNKDYYGADMNGLYEFDPSMIVESQPEEEEIPAPGMELETGGNQHHFSSLAEAFPSDIDDEIELIDDTTTSFD